MPPRLRNPRLPSLNPTSTCSHQPPSNLPQPYQCVSKPHGTREFSSTPAHALTKLRRDMLTWLNGAGESFRHPLPNSTNYLSAYDRKGQLLRGDPDQGTGAAPQQEVNPDDPDAAEKIARNKALQEARTPSGEQKLPKEGAQDLRPFPQNAQFSSQSILSEELRNEIWRRVKLGKSVRAVSVELGVDMRRVGAVVRLVDIEKQWIKERKPLAKPYARAIHDMVPTTPYIAPPLPPTPHESINDLPVHGLTRPQIFHPTSESSPFNRVDAGRVFSAAPRSLPGAQPRKREFVGKVGVEEEILLPAEDRIPHPHLVEFEKDKISVEFRNEAQERAERYAQRLMDDDLRRAEAQRKEKARKEAQITRIDDGRRWEFRVQDVVASRDRTGLTGRGTGAPGMRYGAPNDERKRGKVKIPTRINV